MKKNMTKMLALGLALAMTSGMMVGCSSGSSDSKATTAAAGNSSESGAAKTTKTSDRVLKFACQQFSENIDPAVQVNAAWNVSRFAIGETLFKFDEEMNIQQNLCDTYEKSDDNKTWTLHIVDGLKYSNGNDCNPTAIVNYLNMLYDKEEQGTDKGYTATPSKFIPKDNIQELKADDEKGTVTFVFKKGCSDLPNRLAFPFFVILDSTSENMSECPIGTGPYAVSKYSIGSTNMSLKANEYYWKETVPFSGLEINFVSDSTTKAMALQNGDVDLTENVATISDLQNLKDSSDYNVDVAAGLRCGFSYINQQKGHVLANDDLRKAVLMAIDDDTICNTIVGGMYTPGCSVVPSHLDYGYDQLKDATPYDVDGAKKILDDAGIKDTDGDGIRELDGKNIELTYYTYDNRALKELAEASATNIEELGIKVNLQVTASDTEWNYLVAGEYDLLANNWTTAEIGDPYSYLDNWYSKSSANYCGYKNKEFDKIYEALADITDKEERKAEFVKLQQILIDDSAALVHGYYNSNMDSNKSITGATTHTADYYWITTDIKPAE